MSRHGITVIIPTLALGERRESLMRAIDSVLTQACVDARPLVVVNGERYSPELRAELETMSLVRTLYVPQGNVGLAQHVGVGVVDTPYFSFLDDDDLLLPGGLSALCDEMISLLEPDYVVGNGYVADKAGERLLFPCDESHLAMLRADPARVLLQRNWLASCGGLYRRGAVGTEVFDASLKHFEWTYYGFRLACAYKGAFIAAPVFRVSDTPGSASKTVEYALDYCGFLGRLESVAMALRPDLVDIVQQRELSAYNGAAVLLSKQGRVRDALAYHRQVLQRRGGWRYLPSVLRTLLRCDS